MIQIPRRHPTELPTEPGRYLVHDAASAEPLVLKWPKGAKRWQYPKSVATPAVVGWIGPVRGVPDEFGGQP